MFVSTNPEFVKGAGKIAGAEEKFKGFAVLLHLFPNAVQTAPNHKQIRVLVNNGDNSKSFMKLKEHACQVDFSMEKIRLKLMVHQHTLFVLADQHATGQWADCMTVALGAEFNTFLDTSYFGKLQSFLCWSHQLCLQGFLL